VAESGFVPAAIDSGALPCSTQASIALKVSNRSGPTPPLQCCIPGTKNNRTLVAALSEPCIVAAGSCQNMIERDVGIAGSEAPIDRVEPGVHPVTGLQVGTRETAQNGQSRSDVIAAREQQPGVHIPSGTRAASRFTSMLPVQIVLATVVVFGVPFALFYRLILFHFYVRGGFLLDTGLLGSLMWHNTFALTMPANLGGQSFFAIHVAPLLSLVSAASDLLPFTMPRLFGSFIGICHGLLALGMFWLLVQGHGMRRGWELALAALAAVAFAFNGLALAIARYPHFEIFAAACLLLFFVALVLEQRAIAIVSFMLALATREDVGLHAFGFLTLWLGVNWLRGAGEGQISGLNARLAGFAVAGLTYSTMALLLQHWAFPGSSSFVRIYLGEPALSHVSRNLVTMRVFGWVMIHSAVFLPAAAILVWAERSREPFIIAGFVACIPWALLHLLAVSDYAGWMVGYYAYPFLVALAWPLLAGVTPSNKAPINPFKPALQVLALVGLTLLPLGSDFDPGKIPLPGAFLHAPSAEQQRQTDRAIAAVVAAGPALGHLVVDRSVAGLAPLSFARTEIAGSEEAPANTVVFMEDGFDSQRLRALPDLPVRYAVPGTMVRIMTDRPESILREIGLLP
jgi:hypothetical protein